MKSHEWYAFQTDPLEHLLRIGYVAIPIVFLKLTKQSMADMHCHSLVPGHRKLYLLALVILPPVFIISFEPEYQDIYPFTTMLVAPSGPFPVGVYVLSQFFALEFFFRGFMVSQLRKWYSTAPYSSW